MKTPIIGFVSAHRNMGKTTLIEKLLRLCQQHQLRVGTIKHTHHDIDIDHPGKDSYRFRHAGAQQTLISCQQRWALIHEYEDCNEPDLDSLIMRLQHDTLDLIIFEGFKAAPYPKIEVYRHTSSATPLAQQDDGIIAIASDDKAPPVPDIPVLDLNNAENIFQFLETQFELAKKS